MRMDMLERLDQQIRPLIVWRNQKSTEAKPIGSTGNGGFLVQADMLSILGCSWEEMKEILPALGFSVERKKIIVKTDSPEAKKASRAALEALKGFVSIKPEETIEESPAEEQFEEIWRPKRQQNTRPQRHKRSDNRDPQQRREQTHSRGPKHKRGEGRPPRKGPDRNQKQGGAQSRPRPKPRRADPDSPFAALGDLKKALEQKK